MMAAPTHPLMPFNRTSMESKHGYRIEGTGIDYAFNRTSMESKLGTSIFQHRLHHAFNRTSMESKLNRLFHKICEG